jgi:hypothetical protein
MKKILILFLLSTGFIFAQDAGKTGLSFLKFGFGARNIALGNLGVVSSNDVTSLFYNPSILANMDRAELMFTHNEWIQDVRSEMIGAGFKLFGLPLAVGINTTTVADIEIRTRPGEAESKFNANYFSGSISTGFHLLDYLAFGVTAKYDYENILSDDASGIGYDFGLYYTSPFEGLSFGTAVRNLGKMNELRNESTKMPSDFSLAGMYTFFNDKVNSQISIIAGGQKYLDVNQFHFNLGGEVFYNDLIAARVGYQTGFKSENITAGIGLKYKSLFFDYAFIPYSFDLGTTHTISLKIKI